MYVIGIALLAVTLALPTLGFSQLTQQDGVTIEFVGLRNRSVAEVEDEVRAVDPGVKLWDCAGILRGMGYGSVNVTDYVVAGRKRYVSVEVVEPEFSSRISYRATSGDSFPDAEDWSYAIASWRESNRLLHEVIRSYYDVPVDAEREKGQEQVLMEFLQARNGSGVLENALETLRSDRNPANRAIALALLMNFRNDPRSWRSVLDETGSKNAGLAITAALILRTMARSQEGIVVDWRPAKEAIWRVLKGSNIYLFDEVVEALLRTNVDGSLIRELVSADTIIPDRMRALNPRIRELATGLSTRAHDADVELNCGIDCVYAWIKSLEAGTTTN